MKVTDPDLMDVLFLDRHPGWTWHDLATAPDIIVAGLKMLDVERARG